MENSQPPVVCLAGTARRPSEVAMRVGVLACRRAGVSACWRIGVLVYRHPGVLASRCGARSALS